MWVLIKKYFSHESLRNIATTLKHFSLIQISTVAFFNYLAYDLLIWYKSFMSDNPESFNGVAFWGAVAGIVAGIFSSIKYINDMNNTRGK